MTYEEDQILKYLESVKDYVSVREIGRRVGGRMRFQKDPNWAKPVLLGLMKEDLVEMDLMGHFRFKPPKAKKEEAPAPPQSAEAVEPGGKDAEPSGQQPPAPEPPSDCSSMGTDNKSEIRNPKSETNPNDPKGE